MGVAPSSSVTKSPNKAQNSQTKPKAVSSLPKTVRPRETSVMVRLYRSGRSRPGDHRLQTPARQGEQHHGVRDEHTQLGQYVDGRAIST